MSKIDVIRSCNVGMATPNEYGIAISKLDLTPWDLQYLLLVPNQRGILFHKPDEESLDFEKTFIDHLKTSLSRTLGFFPPLAGRLGTITNEDNTTSFFVDCNNEGAEFTYAIARGVSVSDVLNPLYTPEVVYSFFSLIGIHNSEGISKPLLAVQVTELVDGFFIGCSINHVIADGTSLWHFFNSWSEISRGFDTISKSPVFERWFPGNINRPIHIHPLWEQQNLLNEYVSPELPERVFRFSKESIAELKSKANSEMGTDKISSFQSLLAHLWRSLVRGRKKTNNKSNNQQVYLFLPIGARERIGLPDSYFGNSVYGSRVVTNNHDLLHHGLGWAALKINELVARQTREEAIKFVEEWEKNHTIQHNKPINLNLCLISSSPRYNVYGNDFGWGRPIAVRSGKGLKVDGKVTVFPAAEPGGIDIEVCTLPQTLHDMEEDAEFMEAVTI